MIKNFDEDKINFIKSAISRADMTFSEFEIEKCIKAVNAYFDSKYGSRVGRNVVDEFGYLKDRRMVDLEVYEKDDAITFEMLEQIIANPDKAFELFLDAEDKKEFVSLENFDVTYDREQNFNNFVRHYFYLALKDAQLNSLERAILNHREVFLETYKQSVTKLYTNMQAQAKEKLILSIIYNVEFLRQLCSFDDMVAKQNEVYAKTRQSTLKGTEYNTSGLMLLGLSEEDKDKVYSKEYLQECNAMQLEAILSFLINRGEKVVERLGTGMYFYYANSVETGNDENVNGKEFWKTMWRKRTFFVEASKEFLKKHRDKLEEAQSQTGAYYWRVQENDFIIFMESYRKAYNLFFPDSDIVEDFKRFNKALGAGMATRYNGKDKLIESLIIYSDKTRSNWGYTKEEDTKSKDKILLSFDVPGLNMPLRLHADKSRIKTLMTQFFNTTEIPVYCGDEDFIVYGNNVGTQALYYVDKSKLNGFKNVINKGKVSPGYKDFAEHIKLLQLENSRKRILKWKTGRETPQYYDLEKDEIINNGEEAKGKVTLSNISASSKKEKKHNKNRKS